MGDRSWVYFNIVVPQGPVQQEIESFLKSEGYGDVYYDRNYLVAAAGEVSPDCSDSTQCSLADRWPHVPWLMFYDPCVGAWPEGLTVYYPEYRVTADGEHVSGESFRTWPHADDGVPCIPVDTQTGLPDEADLERFKKFWAAYNPVLQLLRREKEST